MFWVWAPQLHYPWSGSVAQEIDLEQFFNAIPAHAGDRWVERRAFDVASYGRQLGWITDVLLDAAEAAAPTSERATAALHMLRTAAREIEEIKSIKYRRGRCT
jgi:hypothetical protein